MSSFEIEKVAVTDRLGNVVSLAILDVVWKNEDNFKKNRGEKIWLKNGL